MDTDTNIHVSNANPCEYRGIVHEFPLSQYQKDVVDNVLDGKGNMIIEAVAGSGKTSTLKIIAKYIVDGSKLGVGFFAFNKHIATELTDVMMNYFKEIFGDKPGISCMTLHSLGFSCLRYNFNGIQLNKRKYTDYFRWFYDNKNECKHLREYEDEIPKIFDLARYNQVIPNIDNLQRLVDNYGINLTNSETQKVDLSWNTLSNLISHAMEWGLKFKEHKQCDFTDMIWGPVELKLRPLQFKWVLVDESQDLNRCQRLFSAKAVKWGGRLIYVGDSSQAIYGFAGASTDSMQQIKRYVKAESFPLSVCYRCPKSHIRMAQELVPHIEASDFAIEGEIGQLSMYDAVEMIKPGDLVICRTNAPLIPLAFSLIAKGIGAKIRGRDIAESLVQILENIGKPKKFTWEQFDEFCDLFFQKKIQKILKKNGGKENDPDIEEWNDKRDAVLKIKEITQPETLGQFQDKIRALFDDENKNTLWLSSVHRAKGLEADRVFIINFSKMPRRNVRKGWEFEQELNLKYIALTRAKKAMYFVEEPKMTSGL